VLRHLDKLAPAHVPVFGSPYQVLRLGYLSARRDVPCGGKRSHPPRDLADHYCVGRTPVLSEETGETGELATLRGRVARMEDELRRNEKMAHALDYSPRVCIVADVENGFRVCYVNQAATVLLDGLGPALAVPRDRILGSRLDQLLGIPELAPDIVGSLGNLPIAGTHRVGQEWLDLYVAPILDGGGMLVALLLAASVVTHRQLAAETIHKMGVALGSEGPGAPDELWRLCMANLLASAAERVYFKDRASRFLLVSSGWLKGSAGGRSLEEVIGKTDADIFSAEHAAEALKDEKRIMATGEPVVAKLERETFPDRPDTWVQTTKMPLRDDRGDVVGTFGISRDVTKLHHALQRQAALAKVGEALAAASTPEQIYRALLSGALDIVVGSVSRAAVIAPVRQGLTVVASTVKPVPLPAALEAVRAVLAEPPAPRSQALARRRDNLFIVPMRKRAFKRRGTSEAFRTPEELHGKELGALVLEVEKDLSDASQEAVTWLVSTAAVILDGFVAARRLRSLVSHASDVLVVVTLEGMVRYGAPSVLRAFGYNAELLLGRPLGEFVHPDDLARLLTAIVPPIAPSAAVVEARWRHADGSWRHTETTVADLVDDPEVEGIALSVRDVTARKSLEVELRNAQKLTAIGQLAAGVAHEINTPMQFIADNLQFLGESFGALVGVLQGYRRALDEAGVGDETLRRELTRIEEAADLGFLLAEVPDAVTQACEGSQRVTKIVRALKAFGHPDQGRASPTDLNEAISNTVTVARGELKHVADVVEELGEVPPVNAVPGDISQVFLNLVVNAAHAIADKVGERGERGHITIRTWCEEPYVAVSVADDGTGISEGVAQRIFEPFFTTKEVGRGTGQGLALARSVVERHGGTIQFRSVLGEGTTFVVRLPIDGPQTR
jgi:PAS domain S-box-containing protein